MQIRSGEDTPQMRVLGHGVRATLNSPSRHGVNIPLFATLAERDIDPTTFWQLSTELLSLGSQLPQSASTSLGALSQPEVLTKLWAVTVHWNSLKTGNPIRGRQRFINQVE